MSANGKIAFWSALGTVSAAALVVLGFILSFNTKLTTVEANQERNREAIYVNQQMIKDTIREVMPKADVKDELNKLQTSVNSMNDKVSTLSQNVAKVMGDVRYVRNKWEQSDEAAK